MKTVHPLSAGLLSGLDKQGELTGLLEELYYHCFHAPGSTDDEGEGRNTWLSQGLTQTLATDYSRDKTQDHPAGSII